MSTIADKLITAAQNEQRIYKKGYDKGVVDAGGTVVTKPEVEGNYNITANGSYTYTPPADSVFSKVNVEVAVSGGSEDLNDVLVAQEEKLAELSAILDTKADGYDNGFEDGKKAEYDAFWDAYQQNGKRVHYVGAFAGFGWTDETFKPKYDIRPREAGGIFSSAAITDVKGMLEKQGVVLDLSNLTGLTYLAQGGNTKITRLPELNVSKVSSLSYFIQALEQLKSIDKVILKSDGSQDFTNYSFGCLTSLEEIRFEGVIGKAGFNMQWSTKLSHDSIESIIYSLSMTTSGLSITLSRAAVNKAFETSNGANDGSNSEEFADLCIERDNWTITLV